MMLNSVPAQTCRRGSPSILKINSALIATILLVSKSCFAVETSSAVGLGVQYGGIIDWQWSLSAGFAHGRVAVGLPGFSFGGDISLSEHITVGFTQEYWFPWLSPVPVSITTRAGSTRRDGDLAWI